MLGRFEILDYNVWIMSFSCAAACLHTPVFAHGSVLNFCSTNLDSSLGGFRDYSTHLLDSLFLRPWLSLFLYYAVLCLQELKGECNGSFAWNEKKYCVVPLERNKLFLFIFLPNIKLTIFDCGMTCSVSVFSIFHSYLNSILLIQN